MQAADIMTTPVTTADVDMTVRDAARTMVAAGISGMPVIDRAGVLVGMVTEGDLLHRDEIGTGVAHRAWWLQLLASTRQLADEYVREHANKVSEVMSTDVITVDENCPVARIAELLEHRRIKRVPVMRDGKMVGVVSRANLLRALVTLAPAAPTAASSDDRAIHAGIMQAMKGERWALPAASVIVGKGTVHLWGIVMSDAEARALRVAAENVAGVTEVVSHLELPSMLPAA